MKPDKLLQDLSYLYEVTPLPDIDVSFIPGPCPVLPFNFVDILQIHEDELQRRRDLRQVAQLSFFKNMSKKPPSGIIRGKRSSKAITIRTG